MLKVFILGMMSFWIAIREEFSYIVAQDKDHIRLCSYILLGINNSSMLEKCKVLSPSYWWLLMVHMGIHNGEIRGIQ